MHEGQQLAQRRTGTAAPPETLPMTGTAANDDAHTGTEPSCTFKRGLCQLLRLTDTLRGQVLTGHLLEASCTQAKRERLIKRYLAKLPLATERAAVVEVLCAMLNMDAAVLSCLEMNRSQAIGDLVGLQRRQHELHTAQFFRFA